MDSRAGTLTPRRQCDVAGLRRYCFTGQILAHGTTHPRRHHGSRSNGYLTDHALQPGKTGAAEPATWATEPGAFTADGTGYLGQYRPVCSTGNTDPVQYGYAYMNSATDRYLRYVPAERADHHQQRRAGSRRRASEPDRPAVDTITLYRTAQGGSIFSYSMTKFPNPGVGQTGPTSTLHADSQLNTEIQAQIDRRGNAVPFGSYVPGLPSRRASSPPWATWFTSQSGPDAVVSGISGNAGFDTTFTAQSKITRFWACSLGMVVFTVRDAYIILGSATEADPLYMVVFIEDLPLKSYDCFTINKTTPYLYHGQQPARRAGPERGNHRGRIPHRRSAH